MSKKEYAVEKIVDHSYDVEANDIMYLVKWKGFDSSENTWESSKTLHKCKESIKCYWQIKSVNKISVVADLYNLSFPNPEKRSTTIIINPSEAMVLIDGFCYRQAYKSGNTYLYVKVIDKFIPANKITYGDMGFEPSLCTSDHILGTSSVCQIIGPSLKFLSVESEVVLRNATTQEQLTVTSLHVFGEHGINSLVAQTLNTVLPSIGLVLRNNQSSRHKSYSIVSTSRPDICVFKPANDKRDVQGLFIPAIVSGLVGESNDNGEAQCFGGMIQLFADLAMDRLVLGRDVAGGRVYGLYINYLAYKAKILLLDIQLGSGTVVAQVSGDELPLIDALSKTLGALK